MSRRLGVMAMMVIAMVGAGGCGSGSNKQWYKPGGDYTVAGFEQDRKACTKSGDLNESCLRERGWIPVSADREAPVTKDLQPRRY